MIEEISQITGYDTVFLVQDQTIIWAKSSGNSNLFEEAPKGELAGLGLQKAISALPISPNHRTEVSEQFLRHSHTHNRKTYNTTPPRNSQLEVLVTSLGLDILIGWLNLRKDSPGAGPSYRTTASITADQLRIEDIERRRFARDLHDGACQDLALSQLYVEQLRKAKFPAEITKSIESLGSSLKKAHDSISALAHRQIELRPRPAESVIDLVMSLRSRFAHDFDVELDLDELPSDIKLSARHVEEIILILQEALTNVSRHARADSVVLRAKLHCGRLSMQIEDDGVGIPRLIASGHRKDAQGVGLISMRSRARSIGGTLSIDGSGSGTLLSLELPV
ncbi:sensor histidine kinase [Novosphingobium sp. BL-8A]|uniref:sensor histidine kinase n=1 Tax=Novosphingobium sp. BL-8A TaxID=3127639 RepID=UPI0037574A1B